MKIKATNQFGKFIEIEILNNKIKKIKNLDVKENDDLVIPGFIDVHTHGGYGFDWNIADKEGAKKYLYDLATKEGTTSVLGTILTATKESIKEALMTNGELVGQDLNGSNLLGFHFEGVFLNPLKKGGHPENLLTPLTKEDFLYYYNDLKEKIKYVTYAPELTTPEVTKFLSKKKIIASVGHTMATKEIILPHIKKGLTNLTHYNNAMIKYGTEGDSLAKYAISSKDLYIELINDGVHNTLELAKQIYKEKPNNKLILITDSLNVKGLPDGEYKGPNWLISKKNGAAWTPTGTLTGSTYTMHNAFKDWVNKVGASIDEAVKATSTNAATCLRVKKGQIKKGFDADLLILDKNLEIKKIIINGKELK